MTEGDAQRSARSSADYPIFIVGASRSGTNLLRAAMNKHSTLWISGETHYFDDLRTRLDPHAGLVDRISYRRLHHGRGYDAARERPLHDLQVGK